jgi:hypothetical protein
MIHLFLHLYLFIYFFFFSHACGAAGTVTFEAQATNDIHVSFNKDTSRVEGRDGLADQSPNYEVVIGGAVMRVVWCGVVRCVCVVRHATDTVNRARRARRTQGG